MKGSLLIVVALPCFAACSQTSLPYDDVRAAKSAVVVRAKLLERGLNCDKYCTHRYAVLRIFKGAQKLRGSAEIPVDALSFGEMPPDGECTLYLAPLGTTMDRWILVDDDLLRKWSCESVSGYHSV